MIVFLMLQSCGFGRAIRYALPNVDDLRVFSADTVHRSEKPFTFFERSYKPLPPSIEWVPEKFAKKYYSVEEFLIETGTTSFLVVREDSIIYENYFNDYFIDHPQIIFSITKAMVTSLVGIAIDEGYLNGTQHKVAEFFPEFAKDERRDITLEHLLQMTSGLNRDDYHNPLKLTGTYYSNDLVSAMKKVKLKHEPGSYFAYKSIDTQILGYCLEQAVGKRISQYLKEKLWDPMGMEYNGYMTVDSDKGSARMYGGMAACARDLAKFGRLYLNNGMWEGKQLIPEAWVTKSSTIQQDGGWWGYSTGWWFNDSFVNENLYSQSDFFAVGFSGQILYVNPFSNIIIIRQGRGKNGVNWMDLSTRLAERLNKCSPMDETPIDEKSIVGIYQSKKGAKVKLVNRKDKEGFRLSGIKIGGQFKTVSLEREAPQSLVNQKKQKRVILETVAGKVVGFYLDNFRRKATYFERLDEKPEAFEIDYKNANLESVE